MNYALIENGTVINIIWLHPMNASEFANAVPMNDLQIAIGDTYVDGKFYRNGEEVTSAPVEPSEPPGQSEQDTEQAVVDSIMQEVSSYGY